MVEIVSADCCRQGRPHLKQAAFFKRKLLKLGWVQRVYR